MQGINKPRFRMKENTVTDQTTEFSARKIKSKKEIINMSRDINNKYWDEELETLPREELQKRQLEDLKEIVSLSGATGCFFSTLALIKPG